MHQTLNGKTILIVDDEADLLDILKDEFTLLGCRVLTANSGNTALEIFHKESLDAVISDIRMPGGTGIDLLKGIRQHSRENPAVFLITGYTDQSSDQIYQAGADGIFSKPFALKDLKIAVASALA